MLTKFKFEPEAGLLDFVAYATDPDSENAAREQLQRPHEQMKAFINETLTKELEGKNGAAQIGAAPLFQQDVSGTVQEKLLALRGAILESVAGVMPDGSVTEAKLNANFIFDGGEY